MEALFVEMPPFERHRETYLNDEAFRELQIVLMLDPYSGDVIQHTGGLRKLRYKDLKRGKGSRGGLRVIYYWWQTRLQFLLFTLYNKNEMADLTHAQCHLLHDMLEQRIRGI